MSAASGTWRYRSFSGAWTERNSSAFMMKTPFETGMPVTRRLVGTFRGHPPVLGGQPVAAGHGRTPLRHDDDTVSLTVADSGIGVSKEELPKLLSPYFRTSAAKETASGTGLGLYIAREICEANAATLDYVERPVGAQFSLVCKGVSA